MALSVQVRAYGGIAEAFCTHPAIARLCRRAADLALPLLGCVDPFDDTVFNRAQLSLLLPELARLSAAAPPDEADAAYEITRLARHLQQRPHRYLVFAGD